jgi:hypothetical protein
MRQVAPKNRGETFAHNSPLAIPLEERSATSYRPRRHLRSPATPAPRFRCDGNLRSGNPLLAGRMAALLRGWRFTTSTTTSTPP